jgi:hypothetical protein
LFFNDRLSLELDLPPPFSIAQINLAALLRDAEENTDFFKQFSHHRNPMSKSLVRPVAATQYFLRLRAGKAAASRQDFRRIIVAMNRPAGENVKASKKAHLGRAASQQNFKSVMIVCTNENDGGGIAGLNHIAREGLGVRGKEISTPYPLPFTPYESLLFPAYFP